VAGVATFWGVFSVWVLSELWLAWRCRLPEDVPSRDRGSRWLLITGVWGGVLLGIALAFVVRGAAFRGDRGAFVAAGTVLMAAGMALRWYAIRVLGTSFTVTVTTRTDQRIVDRGPYRLVRHPSYTGGLLTAAGVLVCCANAVSLLAVLPVLAGYAYRIRVEEQALTSSLGDAYRAYMRRTRRLVPFVV
jgi:protein-S-isoprenylcysteine O-methyltransferase